MGGIGLLVKGLRGWRDRNELVNPAH